MKGKKAKRILISILSSLLLLTLLPSLGLADLISGVPVADSVALQSWKNYQISTSATDTKLEVTLTGISTDVDLYVRKDFWPTTSSWDCRPYLGGPTSEMCTINNPGAKTWYIGVYGYQAGNYTVKATITGAVPPPPSGQFIPGAWSQKLSAAQRFELVLDGAAVLDKETGLVWEKSPLTSTYNWGNAIFYCPSLYVGGRMGWHLPTVEQLSSLVDRSVSGGPKLPSGHPFIGVQLSYYWSATTDVHDSAYAWLVGFGDGYSYTGSTSNGHYTWCARGGQSLDAY